MFNVQVFYQTFLEVEKQQLHFFDKLELQDIIDYNVVNRSDVAKIIF